MSSSSSDSATIEEGAQTSLPPMPLGEILDRMDTLERQRRGRVTNLIREVGHGDFWTQTRCDQISRMLDVNEVHGVTQMEIAKVLGVSKSLVSRVKRRKEANLDVTGLSPGKPSELTVVFPLLKEFVKGETQAKRAVTKSVLMAFVSDHIVDPEVTWDALYRFMRRHGNSYKLCDTTDAPRADVKADDIIQFYTRTLPEALNGTHPSLVFNMDEMGAEMSEDRKNVFVFVPPYQEGTPVQLWAFLALHEDARS